METAGSSPQEEAMMSEFWSAVLGLMGTTLDIFIVSPLPDPKDDSGGGMDPNGRH